MRGMDYPKRSQPVFAQFFNRLMAKTCAAQTVGADGCWLLSQIVAVEDAKRYSGPVRFFNQQLLPILGCSSPAGLARVRSKCIEAGWLHYESGGKGIAGLYWVTIPDEAASIDGTFFDELPEPATESKTPPVVSEPAPLLSEPEPAALTDLVSGCGVVMAARAVSAALRVVDANYVRAVVAHFQSIPNGWAPAALVWRLETPAVLALPPAEGWPEVNPTAKQRAATERERDHNETTRAAQQQLARETANTKQIERARFEQLELDFGAAIDAAEDSEILILLSPFEREQLARGNSTRRSPLIRRHLLEAYSNRG
jgi:hypothetical protein